jgi:hypothetical protein
MNATGTAGVTRSVTTAGEGQTFTHSVGWRGGGTFGPDVGGAQIEAQGALKVTPGGINGQWGEGAYAFEGPLAPKPGGGTSFEFRVPPQTAVESISVPGQAKPIIRLVPPPGQSTVPIQIIGNDFAPGALEAGQQAATTFRLPLGPRVPFAYPPGADLGITKGVTGLSGALGHTPNVFIGPSKPVDDKSPQVPAVGVNF